MILGTTLGLVVTAVAMVGSLLQGTIGFGLGVFAVPILLLIAPELVPGPILATSVVLTLLMTHRDRHAVLVRDLKWALMGRVFGIAAGLALLVYVPAERLGAVLGGLVIAGVVMTGLRARLAVTPSTLAGAGAISGFMGTAVAVGGPPMALLYQHESGPRVRGTLSAYFLIGIVMSLVGLHLVDRFGWPEVQGTLVLLPGTLLGYVLSRRTAARLDRGYTRRAILALSTLTGLLVIAQHTIAAVRDHANIRVATYNIRHGRGMDSLVNLERTAAVLRRLDADVIGLQEVDRLVERSGGVDQAASLGRLLDMHHTFGAFMPYRGGEYGMALLSRHPIERVHRLVLPDGNEPRIALMAELRLPSGDRVVAINVHFDWVEDDGFRFAQVSALRAVLDTLSLPYLMLGDFNDVPGSRTLRLFDDLNRAPLPAPAALTFPSTDPERQIDYILAGPAAQWSMSEGRVIPEIMASDHRPVRAAARLNSPSASPAPARRP